MSTQAFHGLALSTTLTLLGFGCEAGPLSLPPSAPVESAGSISGRVVVSTPGSPVPVAASGAQVSLARTSLRATTDADGRFTLDPVTQRGGSLQLRFDADGDGKAELSRVVDLTSTPTAPGRDVALGDLLLARNASIRGRAVRVGTEGDRTGHSGTTVLVAETPFLTLTGDDGTFVLSDLPAGPVTVTAWRDGFESVSISGLELRPGESFALDDLVLPEGGVPGAPGTLQLRLDAAPDGDLGAVALRALGTTSQDVTVPASGQVSTTLTPGVWTLVADLDGYGTGLIPNLIVRSGETTDAGTLTLFAGGTVIPVDKPQVQPGPVDPLLEAPAARISAPAVAAAGRKLLLDGTASKAALAPPGLFLSYAWTVLSGEAALEVTPNGSALAGRAAVNVPADATRLTVGLAVLDVRTSLTALATTTIDVLPPPEARITPTKILALPGGSVTFDGAASTGAAGTLAYDWSSASLAVNDVDTPAVTFVAPSSPGSYTLSLVVSDGVLRSDPATATLEVVAAIAPPVVNAGGDKLVDTGTEVTLDAQVESAEDYTLAWTQVAGTPVTLADANTRTPRFRTPDSFDQLVFRVAATNTAGSASDEVVVEVRDRTPPRVIATEPAEGLSASPFFVAFTFSEPIDPSTLGVGLEESGNQAGLPPPRVTWDGDRRRVVVSPAHPFRPGGQYAVGLSGLRDLSPVPNAATDFSFTFTARPARWRTWTTHESDVPWLPAVLPGPPPIRFATLAKPSGCGGGSFHPEIHRTTDAGGAERVATADGCHAFDSYRGLRATRTADGHEWIHTNGGHYRFDGVRLASITTVGIFDAFTDGAVPYLLSGDDFGCEILRWNPSVSQFQSFGRYSCYRGSAHAVANAQRLLGAGTHTAANPPDVRVFERTATTGFVQLGTNMLSPSFGEVAVAYLSDVTPLLAAHHTVGGTGFLTMGRWDGSAWLLRERVNPAGPATGVVELVVRPRFAFVAYTAASRLRAFTYDPLDDASPIVPVEGPSSETLTAPGCTAHKPVAAIDDEGINLSWSESCPSGWKSVIARWE